MWVLTGEIQMNAIEMQGENRFVLNSRGSEMVLFLRNNLWIMHTKNASTRAWSNGVASVREFQSLVEVEAKYKSWRGISALIEPKTTAIL